MQSIINSVTYNKTKDIYAIDYVKIISRGRRRGECQAYTRQYPSHKLPQDVQDWIDSEVILKEEDIDNAIAHTIIGSYQIVNGELDYRYASDAAFN